MTRPSGFYWVIFRFTTKREVARWCSANGKWYITGVNKEFTDYDIKYIGDRIEPPLKNDGKWQEAN